jgi:hypothetical protein
MATVECKECGADIKIPELVGAVAGKRNQRAAVRDVGTIIISLGSSPGRYRQSLRNPLR